MGKNAATAEAKTAVAVGSTVLVAFDTGTTLTVTIKTPREADPARGVVSYESPIGKALLNKQEGDEFQYVVSDRRFAGKVIKINRLD